jgi:hypothetical protein
MGVICLAYRLLRARLRSRPTWIIGGFINVSRQTISGRLRGKGHSQPVWFNPF